MADKFRLRLRSNQQHSSHREIHFYEAPFHWDIVVEETQRKSFSPPHILLHSFQVLSSHWLEKGINWSGYSPYLFLIGKTNLALP